MIVLDASVVIEILLNHPVGLAVRDSLAQDGGPIATPHLMDIEVMSAFRALSRTERVPVHRRDEFLAHLTLLPAERYPHTPLLPRIWELRHNFSAYDAAYIALAEILDAELYTADRRLAHGHRARVKIFP